MRPCTRKPADLDTVDAKSTTCRGAQTRPGPTTRTRCRRGGRGWRVWMGPQHTMPWTGCWASLVPLASSGQHHAARIATARRTRPNLRILSQLNMQGAALQVHDARDCNACVRPSGDARAGPGLFTTPVPAPAGLPAVVMAVRVDRARPLWASLRGGSTAFQVKGPRDRSGRWGWGESVARG